MAGDRSWTARKRVGVFWLSSLAGLALPAAAWAQAYPSSDAAWVPLVRTDPVTNVTSPLGDPAGDAPGPRDIVGNEMSPVAYVQSDADHLYFRLRINQNARQNASSFWPYGWGCLIDTDGDSSDYELIAIVDGVSNPDSVNLWHNTNQVIPNDPSDDAEVLLRAYLDPLVAGKPGHGYAREAPAGEDFPAENPDPDFFVDWAVERSALALAGVTPLTPLRFACGTSAMGKVLGTDLAGPPSLPPLFGDPVLCGDEGCIEQSCPGAGDICEAGVGGCATTGTIVCDASGQPSCNAVPGASSAEVCDDVDNDCDGAIDEDNPGAGVDCTSSDPGLCAAGLTACVGGALSCIPTIGKGEFPETCNGIDDDCNGIPDDGPAGAGEPCATGLMGACATGFTTCGGGVTACAPVAEPGAAVETCNGVDDDCDGEADEGFALGEACSVGVGACLAEGVFECDAAGAASCSATAGAPGVEACGDAVDSDCDGNPDNDCPDKDDDGLEDHEEEVIGSDPEDPDTDDDGVRDGLEPDYDKDTDGDGTVNVLDPDSDDDGLFDGTELGFDCTGPGTDPEAGHCIADADSGTTTTNPLDWDTDDGSVSDGDEDTNKDGVVDAGERDPLDPSDDVISTAACSVDADCPTGQVCAEGACRDLVAPQESVELTGGCACTTEPAEGTTGRWIAALVMLGALTFRRRRR
ncbi:MopE-related protein [Polyangium spumosum]|uniref:MYXO-CTERM sorting domain-containing protein n=1 Tax=Polyangium spumosum TaxID=889282 RepID=A0A6N7PEB0_9BACT|nr:MopE-related protein [Polyangium spumosum]MRG90393.1 MYXO-CTERM sorting domain-containing protein [Polyangium spumosum]